VRVVFSGNWKTAKLPSVRSCAEELEFHSPSKSIEMDALPEAWDSRFVAFIFALQKLLAENGFLAKLEKFPTELRGLMGLAAKGSDAERRREVSQPQTTTRHAQRFAIGERVQFLGSMVKGILLFCQKKTSVRGTGFGRLLRQAGFESLPIVATVSFLIGTILGFIGSLQLERFGAAIFVADLVAIATVREMAPLMTAVVLAGRVGAAFSATIASMRTRGEIDALSTFGISAMDFLAVPRVVAMAAMTPLLCVISVLVSTGGGMAVAIPMLNVGCLQYVHESAASVKFGAFCFGIGKSVIFALIIAPIACRSGMICERTADGVGRATTRAVVNAITAIIVADALCDAMAARLRI
jgi:phospholipid/cholesterol/gamma-HCH transport system permease protein